MAEPSVIEGRLLVISVGDGESPEVFSILCGVNSAGFNRTGQTADRFIRDCATPNAFPWRKVVKNGKQVDLSASGYYNLDNRALIDGLWMESKNYRLSVYEDDATTLVGYWHGAAVATSINMGGAEEDLSTIELTIASDGIWTWTDAP